MIGAPRVCPECGEEYLSTVLECVDCRVPLVAQGEPRVDEPRELPPVAQLVCVRAASLGFAQGLSERLAEAGIAHRIEVAVDLADEGAVRRPGANLPYGVYVRAADAPVAQGIDRDFMRSMIPDLPDEAEGAAGGEGCPACGTAVAPDATECPDCGLALLEPS